MAKKLADLPVDSKVEFLTFWGEPVVWRVVGSDLADMPADSATLVSDKLIAVLPFDAKEPTNSDSDRREFGNSDWTVSNLREWLNSEAGAGAWYSAQHPADQPPDDAHVDNGYNDYQKFAGFLNGATQDEKNALLVTDRNIGGWSSNAKTCKDRIFLLTTNEYGLETVANNGTKIAYFTDNASRLAYPTAQCVAHTEWSGNPSSAQSHWYYWTATSYPSDSYSVRFVRTVGSLSYGDACSGLYGVRPACNLSSDILVSDSTNAAGNYTLTFAPPALYLAGDWTGEDGAAPQTLAWVPADATHRFLDETGQWSRIEVAPRLPDIATASWDEISEAADLAASRPDDYSALVGQEKTFSYGGNDVTARIVGIAQDDRAAGGKVGFTFEIYRGMGTHNMNSSNTTAGGYASSAMKTYIDGLAFPADLQPLLQEFVVHYRDGSNVNTAAKTLNAKAALMSARNMYWPGCQGENGYGSYFWEDEGPTYQYFTNNDTLQARIHYNNSGGARGAWLLSPCNTTLFTYAVSNGSAGYGSASNAFVPAVRFCLGSSI